MEQLTEKFYKKAVLKNFATFTGKYLCWRLFLIKFQAFRITEDFQNYISVQSACNVILIL